MQHVGAKIDEIVSRFGRSKKFNNMWLNFRRFYATI